MSPKMPLICCAWHPAWLPTTISGYLWESSDHPVGFLRLLVLSLGKLIFAPLIPGKTCARQHHVTFCTSRSIFAPQSQKLRRYKSQPIITKHRIALVWEHFRSHLHIWHLFSSRRHQTDIMIVCCCGSLQLCLK